MLASFNWPLAIAIYLTPSAFIFLVVFIQDRLERRRKRRSNPPIYCMRAGRWLTKAEAIELQRTRREEAARHRSH